MTEIPTGKHCKFLEYDEDERCQVWRYCPYLCDRMMPNTTGVRGHWVYSWTCDKHNNIRLKCHAVTDLGGKEVDKCVACLKEEE